jgi:hypothetical protein
MSISWIVILVSFSLMSMLLCYYQNVQLTYSQTDSNSSSNNSISDSIPNEGEIVNVEYPSFWDRIEIPNIKGVLFLSPLKTVGVIVQNITDKEVTSDELYTNLILLMRQNLGDINILSTNTTKSLSGSDMETVEYSYGNDSKKFKILQVMETSRNQVHLFTYFAEDMLYDRFLPLVANMKNTFFYLNENEKPIVKQPFTENDTLSRTQIIPEFLEKNNSDIESGNQITENLPILERNLTYNNPYLGITLEYPSSLNKSERDNRVSFTFNQGSSGIIIGVIPTPYDSLQNFTTEHISNLESNLKNFKIINMSQTNIFTNPTQMLLFNYDNNSILYEGLEFITMEGTYAYIFTYFSNVDTFDRNVPLFSDLIESIQLRNLPRIS